jgi:6,7-dimethyl-8-ribityllumazine synthase
MKKILITEAVFYKKISAMLLEGAIKKIIDAGYEYEIVTLPGALEIPAAVAFAHSSNKKYDGYVALACVIRGQTTHYDYVCLESIRGLNELAFQQKLAIGCGIITAENQSQALERADSKKKDKGGFAAKACMEMIKLKQKFNI